jgi:hypothetical protein
VVEPSTGHLHNLYEQDETAWLERMAELVAERRFDELDCEHLGEYLQDMARRDKREVYSRLVQLLLHLLKWEHQPDQRSSSWRATILTQRYELQFDVESGSLRRHALETLPKAYETAVRLAVVETDLPRSTFPAELPWSLDEVMSDDEPPDLEPPAN